MAKDWTDSLKDKMDNYAETPGAEVWRGVAERTGIAVRRHFPVWVPSLAAAAAMLAGVFLVPMNTDLPADAVPMKRKRRLLPWH